MREIEFRGRCLDNGKRSQRRHNLMGKRFGRIRVIDFDHVSKHGDAYWKCLCDCGNEIIASASNLKRSAGIGCVKCKNEYQKRKLTKHGETGTRLHNIWMHMHDRCSNPSNPDYRNYGSRGISVCQEWDDFIRFRDWALANGYSNNLTIDRIDVNDNYEPSNCRWATMLEQANNKRNTKYYTIGNETRALTDWCTVFNINPNLVRGRLKRGVDLIVALTSPKQKPFGLKHQAI